VFTSEQLQKNFDELVRSHNIPGAQLAVMDGDQITEVATGVLSLRTQFPVSPDALFLPGSIGKVYTATLILMLVDDGKLDLDSPVRRYLPNFTVRDDVARDTVTVRNLLSHTSGFDGDIFLDTGRGDDALSRYVDALHDLPQIAAPGAIWSYGNSGYSILGRIIEVVADATYEQVLHDRVFQPLQLEHTVAFAEDVLLHPASVGHSADPSNAGAYAVSPTWGLFRSCGPMGAAVVASAGDVLRFASMHLRGGLAPDDKRVLSEQSVQAMQTRQVDLVDDSLIGQSWGLGWLLDRWGDVAVIGHDGNSIGQNAFLRVAPEQRFGFCMQTNVDSALELYKEVAAWLFGERLSVGPRPEPEPTGDDRVDEPERYVGIYQREGVRFDVHSDADGRLLADVVASHAAAELQETPAMTDLPLVPADRRDGFLLKLPIADSPLLAAFFDPANPGGRPTYLHFGGRAHRRAEDS
jgi:CubicO group peptidase (beta-lactamase class C family)